MVGSFCAMRYHGALKSLRQLADYEHIDGYIHTRT